MSAPAILPATRVIWRDPAEIMPDDEIAVLIALDEGTVTEAWKDSDRWHLGDRMSFPVTPAEGDRSPRVMAWAEMPEHPFADEIDLAWQLATPDETPADIDGQEGGAE